MSSNDEREPVTLRGEQWEPIHEPEGWRNIKSGITAGEPWMIEELLAEEAEAEAEVTEPHGH